MSLAGGVFGVRTSQEYVDVMLMAMQTALSGIKTLAVAGGVCAWLVAKYSPVGFEYAVVATICFVVALILSLVCLVACVSSLWQMYPYGVMTPKKYAGMKIMMLSLWITGLAFFTVGCGIMVWEICAALP
jgi:hypothetical protein